MPCFPALAAAVTILASPGLAASGTAGARTFCGVRDGTAGNVSLVDHGREVVELARQGGSQRLADAADARISRGRDGESGLQNGRRYCVTLAYDRRGHAVRVVSARRDGPPWR